MAQESTLRDRSVDTGLVPSRENVIKRAISAVNERDVEAYLACCTDDIQLYTPFAHFLGPNEGAAGIRRFFQDIEDAAPDFHLELERLELVGDQALAFLRAHASGRVSGVPLDAETANLYDFAGDLIKCVPNLLGPAGGSRAPGDARVSRSVTASRDQGDVIGYGAPGNR
jgi:ketosteroid isomerase-like protein